MKIFTNKLSISFVLAALIITACNPIKQFSKKVKKVTYKANPEILAVRGDSVDVGFKVVVPKGTIPPKGVMKIEPLLVFGSDEMVLEPLVIRGKQAPDSSANYTFNDGGGTAEYRTRVLYRPELKNCTLFVQPNIKIKSYDDLLDKCLEIPKDSLALGTITTSLSYKSNEMVSVPESKCSGPRMERKANLYYVVDQTDFRSKLVNKDAKTSNPDELKSLVSYLKEKSDYNLVGITLRSMASPDGTYKRNALLARNRDITVYNFMKRQLKRLGFAEVNDSLFTGRSTVTEQMEDLKAAIQMSNLKSKDYFLSVLNSSDAPDVMERKLRDEYNEGDNSINHRDRKSKLKGKALSDAYPHWQDYQYVLKYIMPRLRRSEITIIGEKGCKSIIEINASVRSGGFDKLSMDEILIYAFKSEDVNEKEKAYRYLTNKYNDDWRGHNNLGAVLIMQKKYSDAKTSLDKALSLNREAGEVYNNLGICYRNMRNYEKAEENYKKAKSMGIKPAHYNMGVLEMARGNYGDAVTNFKASGNTCNFNAGLAFGLNGEYSSGQKSFECMPDNEKDAQSWYIRAIMAARAKDLTNLTTYLKKCIQLDSKYKQAAMEDLEFLSYWKTNEFRSAVN